MTKLQKRKMLYINAIKGGNKPTQILQNNLSKSGLVVNSRWEVDALMNESVKALTSLYDVLNDLNTVEVH